MPDELDLLRWFREDTPEPDEAAWNCARTALADVSVDWSASEVTPPRQHHKRWHPLSRRVAIAAVAGVAAAIAAALIVIVGQGAPILSRPMTTAWSPARPLPGAAAASRASSGTWRLMSDLVARGWQENTAGPEPGPLTCPTTSTCYVEGDNSTSPSGPADMDSFYVSTDGAQTWSVLPVPGGVTFTSALSCASATNCAAGGLYSGHQPVYLTTATGGHSWIIRPLPARVGQIISLDCTSAKACWGMASASGQMIDSGFDLMSDIQFVVTADGGSHFRVVQFPKGELIQSVSCPTAFHCVAVGFFSNFTVRNGPDLDRGILLTSDDGGLTWRQHAWPEGFGPGPEPTVTCADASHCAMIGFIERNGREGNQVGFSSGKDAIQYSVIAFSSDGGVTWVARNLPRSMPYPMIDAMVCPTAQTCYAAGSDLIAQRIGKTQNAGSSVVAVTNDAGRSWRRVSFAVPAKVPGGMQGDSFMDIGQIECPQPDACIAMGVSDQGSTSTPIYTNHG
jgi:hypothetical protein